MKIKLIINKDKVGLINVLKNKGIIFHSKNNDMVGELMTINNTLTQANSDKMEEILTTIAEYAA